MSIRAIMAELNEMNRKLGMLLGIKRIDVKYIKSEQTITVRKVKK